MILPQRAKGSKGGAKDITEEAGPWGKLKGVGAGAKGTGSRWEKLNYSSSTNDGDSKSAAQNVELLSCGSF